MKSILFPGPAMEREVIHSTINVYPKEGGNVQKQSSLTKMEKFFVCLFVLPPSSGEILEVIGDRRS